MLLAVLTFLDRMPPALLLVLILLLGSGTVLKTPAYQSLVPDLVPRTQLPTAAVLNSISINVARAVGPAIAGVLIAQAGVGVTFTVAAATSCCTRSLRRHGIRRPRRANPEPFVAALRAGGATCGTPRSSGGSCSERRALVLPRIRGRLSSNQMIAVASAIHVVTLVAIALFRSVAPALAFLVSTGVAWVVVLSSVNASLRLFLPAWVRGRSLAAYQMVLFGSQALGGLVFGALADLGRAGGDASDRRRDGGRGAATIFVWPFVDTRDMDRSSVACLRPRPAPTIVTRKQRR